MLTISLGRKTLLNLNEKYCQSVNLPIATSVLESSIGYQMFDVIIPKVKYAITFFWCA